MVRRQGGSMCLAKVAGYNPDMHIKTLHVSSTTRPHWLRPHIDMLIELILHSTMVM